MRISDWSSDVCSSDLPECLAEPLRHRLALCGEAVFAGLKRIAGAGFHRWRLGTVAHRLEGATAFDLARLRQVRWAVLLLGFAARHRSLQPVYRRFALAFYLLARRRVVVDAR